MLKSIHIIRIGITGIAVALVMTHVFTGISHEVTSFIMGMGCGLSLTGAGKSFVVRNIVYTPRK